MRPLQPLGGCHLFTITIEPINSHPSHCFKCGCNPQFPNYCNGKKCYLFMHLKPWLRTCIFFSPHFKVDPQYLSFLSIIAIPHRTISQITILFIKQKNRPPCVEQHTCMTGLCWKSQPLYFKAVHVRLLMVLISFFLLLIF